jgi:quercetin dioxygenase-like cupin family protein
MFRERKLKITVEGKIIAFQEGDGILIPSGEEHNHTTTVSCATVQLILFEDISISNSGNEVEQ